MNELLMALIDELDTDGSGSLNVEDRECEARASRFAQNAMASDMGNSMLSVLHSFSTKLYDEYQGSRDLPVLLQSAVICSHAALRRLPALDQESRVTMLRHLGPLLVDLYNDHTGDTRHLDEAVNVTRDMLAVSRTMPDDAEWQQMRRDSFYRLASVLHLRYKESGHIEHLKEAHSSALQALALCQNQDRITRASHLVVLSALYESLFDRSRSRVDIDKAIAMAEEAVSLAPQDHGNRPIFLCDLSNRYHKRYMDSSPPEIGDLNEALRHAEAAVRLDTASEDVRAECLSSLAIALESKYEKFGDDNAINRAMDSLEQALGLKSQQGALRAVWLTSLARCHSRRFIRERELSDAEEAIRLAKDAVRLSAKGTYRRVDALNILMTVLCQHLEQTCDRGIEAAAMRTTQEFLAAAPEADPTQALGYVRLTQLLLRRFEDTESRSYLEEAVGAARQAVALTPPGDPSRPYTLGNLSGAFASLHQETVSESYYRDAVAASREALYLTPQGTSERVSRIRNLAVVLRSRQGHSDPSENSAADDEILGLFRQAVSDVNGRPVDRIFCARRAVAILVNRGDWAEAKTLAQEALELAPLACHRYMSPDDQLLAVRQLAGLASESASLSLWDGQVAEALQQLEFGRGFIFGYAIDEQSDSLFSLRQCNEDLARRYEALRYEASADEIRRYRAAAPRLLNSTSPSDPDIPIRLHREWTEEVARGLDKKRREALLEINNCVEEIRKVKGHERFQMPPRLEDLQKLASEGPIVVVNISRIRADAIIVTPDRVRGLHLPMALEEVPHTIRHRFFAHDPGYGATAAIRGEGTRDITGVDESATDANSDEYSWLWTKCVMPVLDELQDSAQTPEGPNEAAPADLPRIWWVGCGIASSLPFHAAGIDFGNTPSAENALSRMVPSYTPTLKALSRSRARTYLPPGQEEKSHEKQDPILFVKMPTTQGHRALPGVNVESAAVKKAAAEHGYLVNELQNPTASEVFEVLGHSSIAHFACHGMSDPANPFNSHLLLGRGHGGGGGGGGTSKVEKLTLSAVSRLAADEGGDSDHGGANTSGPRFWMAFLSACSTAEVRATQWADEGLHLAGAFQVAGFTHVVGALWAADDWACAFVAGQFYTELMGRKKKQQAVDHRDVPGSLRCAVMKLRDGPHGKHPSIWAPFVHFGA